MSDDPTEAPAPEPFPVTMFVVEHLVRPRRRTVHRVQPPEPEPEEEP